MIRYEFSLSNVSAGEIVLSLVLLVLLWLLPRVKRWSGDWRSTYYLVVCLTVLTAWLWALGRLSLL